MSISIEALAMAGADYIEFNMDFEEWEIENMEKVPQYLLAEEESTDRVVMFKLPMKQSMLWDEISYSSSSDDDLATIDDILNAGSIRIIEKTIELFKIGSNNKEESNKKKAIDAEVNTDNARPISTDR